MFQLENNFIGLEKQVVPIPLSGKMPLLNFKESAMCQQFENADQKGLVNDTTRLPGKGIGQISCPSG